MLQPLARTLALALVLLSSFSDAVTVSWTDAMAIGVGGRPFPGNTGNLAYARWPAGAQPDLNPGEWSYGMDSAGMFVQFFSDATAVHARYTVRSTNLSSFANFSPLGMSGVDLYAQPKAKTTTTTKEIIIKGSS
jgi:hypothetical protein